MPGNEQLASTLADLTFGELGQLTVRHFPDGETYVRVVSDVERKEIFLVCTLNRADAQLVPLSFTAAAIRQLGARNVQLVAPYLAYMRQDRIFHTGEALSSRLFAELLQQQFDRLITVDPHLHRHASLAEVYDIPTTVVQAAPLLAEWITTHVPDPVIIGPDFESAQWVEAIAQQAGAPWTVFKKVRTGDYHVDLSAPSVDKASGRTPVLVDDIVSSGTTMRQALRKLSRLNYAPAYCLAVHALCSRQTARQLTDKSARFLTSNTVPNATSIFDVSSLIADALVSSATHSFVGPRDFAQEDNQACRMLGSGDG